MNPTGLRPRSPPRFSPEALSDHPFGPRKARINRIAIAAVVAAHLLIIVLGPLPFRFAPLVPNAPELTDAEIVEIVWLTIQDLPQTAEEALRLAAHKLPIATKFVTRGKF